MSGNHLPPAHPHTDRCSEQGTRADERAPAPGSSREPSKRDTAPRRAIHAKGSPWVDGESTRSDEDVGGRRTRITRVIAREVAGPVVDDQDAPGLLFVDVDEGDGDPLPAELRAALRVWFPHSTSIVWRLTTSGRYWPWRSRLSRRSSPASLGQQIRVGPLVQNHRATPTLQLVDAGKRSPPRRSHESSAGVALPGGSDGVVGIATACL